MKRNFARRYFESTDTVRFPLVGQLLKVLWIFVSELQTTQRNLFSIYLNEDQRI